MRQTAFLFPYTSLLPGRGAGCQPAGRLPIGPARFPTQARTIKPGGAHAPNLESRVKPLADPDVTALVDRLQKTLSQGRVPARLKILDTTEPVASALPGSFLLLSSGAIVRSNTE